MKHKIIIIFACVTALFFCSCKRIYPFHSGNYWLYYYLVNGTSSPMTLERVGNRTSEIAVNDTFCVYVTGITEEGDDVSLVHRPTVEDGYEGLVHSGEKYILTYQDKKYSINEKQTNSFMHCANYKGYESPVSVFIYNYFFVIDDAYIATLPLAE